MSEREGETSSATASELPAPRTRPRVEGPRIERAWGHGPALAAIGLLGALAYADGLIGAFVFDDLTQVQGQPLVEDLGLTLSWRGFLLMPRRWLGYLSFALNRAVTGGDPAGFHAVNVVIHLVTAALVYALVIQAFRTPRLRRSVLAPGAQAIGLVAGVLFATHPLQTQAVTYIVQRFASLATLLYVLATVLFLRWRTRRADGEGGSAAGVALYGGALLASVAAMLTKEIAVTLPIALLLCEVSFYESEGWRRRLFLVPLAATALLPLATLLTNAKLSAPALGAATRVLTSVSRVDYLRTQAPVVLMYLRLLLWPVGQNVDHDVAIAHGFFEPRVVASSAVLLALAALAVALHVRGGRARSSGGLDPAARLVSFGIVWFFVGLSVESSVIPILDLAYEHRVYLPSAGAVVAAATAVALLVRRLASGRWERVLLVGGAALGLVLAVATLERNLVWRNEITLWADAASKSPGKLRPHANVGSALFAAGRAEDGIAELRRAVELDPSFTYARSQLGAAYLATGRLQEAELELRAALALQPRDPETLFNLAMILARSGRREESRPLFRQFLEVAPPAYVDARRTAERAIR